MNIPCQNKANTHTFIRHRHATMHELSTCAIGRRVGCVLFTSLRTHTHTHKGSSDTYPQWEQSVAFLDPHLVKIKSSSIQQFDLNFITFRHRLIIINVAKQKILFFGLTIARLYS